MLSREACTLQCSVQGVGVNATRLKKKERVAQKKEDAKLKNYKQRRRK